MGPDGAFITRQRLPHGWRRDGGLLVRRPRSEIAVFVSHNGSFLRSTGVQVPPRQTGCNLIGDYVALELLFSVKT